MKSGLETSRYFCPKSAFMSKTADEGEGLSDKIVHYETR
jgi:hypothetical protein